MIVLDDHSRPSGSSIAIATVELILRHGSDSLWYRLLGIEVCEAGLKRRAESMIPLMHARCHCGDEWMVGFLMNEMLMLSMLSEA